jgi:phosphate-selective porin OprO and OprP
MLRDMGTVITAALLIFCTPPGLAQTLSVVAGEEAASNATPLEMVATASNAPRRLPPLPAVRATNDAEATTVQLASGATGDGAAFHPDVVNIQQLATPPPDWDLQFHDLAQRLEAAEAEIAALKGSPGATDDVRRLSAVDAEAASLEVETTTAPTADPLAALQSKWDEFLKKANAKTYPNVTIHGVFQADYGWFHQDAASLATFGRIQDGADFRRARLSANGSVTENVNYFLQMDFAFPGRPTFTDVWMEMIDLPWLGAVRIGQWKQPFSLEVVSSFRYTTFAERSLLFNSFTPFRHIGMGFYNHADDLRATWALSAFRSGQDQFGGSISTTGGWSTAGRLTYLPWYDEASEGRYYLHLGGAFWIDDPPFHLKRFRTIPEYFVGEFNSSVVPPNAIGTSLFAIPNVWNGTPFFVDTFALDRVTNVQTLGSELLWVHGPWSLQSESMVALIDRRDNPNGALWGTYAQVGYFLTGEHRPYDRKAGAIDRIIPFENAFWVRTAQGPCHGKGAWEIASRFSHVNLNDAPIRGGMLTDWTMGLNWYLNPYCKIQANYIRAFLDHRRTGKSTTDIFGLRAQIDF